MREGIELVRDMRVDREKGEIRALKETLRKKYKNKLEQYCEGCGWIAVLTRFWSTSTSIRILAAFWMD